LRLSESHLENHVHLALALDSLPVGRSAAPHADPRGAGGHVISPFVDYAVLRTTLRGTLPLVVVLVEVSLHASPRRIGDNSVVHVNATLQRVSYPRVELAPVNRSRRLSRSPSAASPPVWFPRLPSSIDLLTRDSGQTRANYASNPVKVV
jgi:hypothetical protein